MIILFFFLFESLQFCTHIKPDSLSIMKSVDYGKTWQPLQYYSSECEKVYNRPVGAKLTRENEQEALCSDRHLQSSPLSSNRIGFGTLEGRPSIDEFDSSDVLNDWVTATDIRVVFTRLLSPVILRSSGVVEKHEERRSMSQKHVQQIRSLGYYYAAVSEISVGGRCKCNGHASKCFLSKYLTNIISLELCFY